MLQAYGAQLAPGNSTVYDLSKQRWIASAFGSQIYDILPGATASIPGASTISDQLLASGLSQQIASAILLTGVKSLDVPVATNWGPLDGNSPGGSSAIFDLTNYQSIIVSWSFSVLSAANLSPFGQLTLTWYNDLAGTTIVGTDVFEMAGNLTTPGTILTTTKGYIRMPVRGTGLKFTFLGTGVAPGAAGRINASGTLISSLRPIATTQWYTDASADRVLLNIDKAAVPAGGDSSFWWAEPYDGQITIGGWVDAIAGSYLRFAWGSPMWGAAANRGKQIVSLATAQGGGPLVGFQNNLPGTRRPIWGVCHNQDAAVHDFHVSIVCSSLS